MQLAKSLLPADLDPKNAIVDVAAKTVPDDGDASDTKSVDKELIDTTLGTASDQVFGKPQNQRGES